MRSTRFIFIGVSLLVSGCAATPEDEPPIEDESVQCAVSTDCGPNEMCAAGQCQALPPPDPTNAYPTILIDQPTNGSFFHQGDLVTLEATVGDDDTVEGLLVEWHTNRGGVIGGALVDAEGSARLEVSDLVAGLHTLTASVIDLAGAASEIGVQITVDGRPSRPTIRLTPEEPTVADDLTVTLVYPAQDQNRDDTNLTYRYRWFVDQVEREDLTGTKVPHTATIRGQSWTVRVAAADPYGHGDEAPASVVIGNAAPTCEEATLFPSTADTATAFSCLCSERDDLDIGDLVRDTCTFYDDDTVIAEVSGENGACVLSADLTTRGMNVRCELTPTDIWDAGEPVSTPGVLVDNALPATPGVLLSPEHGTVHDAFMCVVSGQSADADGDKVTYEVAWYVNDYPNAPPNPGAVTALSLVRDGSGTPARGGDTLRCEVVARDAVGEVSSPGKSATVVLGNTPPVGGSCAITPSEGVTSTSVLTCSASGATDIDGDPISWTYGWTVTGPTIDPESDDDSFVEATIYPPVTGPKLSGVYFQRDSEVSCVAIPSDGTDAGAPVPCDESVIVLNTMPTLWEVTMTPSGEVGMNESVTCSYAGWSDPDAVDIEEVRYSWILLAEVELSLEDEDEPSFGPTIIPAEVGLTPGDTFICIGRPFNGPDEGEGVYATESCTVVETP